MSGKIFISYRRDDSRYQARMIYEAFLRAMPRENVFMDIDTIPLGVNFVKVLEGWVEQCEVLLVLMGEDWANSADPKTGKRRLDNPKDFVRVEIRGALTRDIPVVPVMLDGAEIPDEAQLPDDIKGLLTRNAEFVEYRTFDGDVQRLLKKLGVGGSAKRAAAPTTIAGTLRDQAIERSTRSRAEDFETQSDLADKARENRIFGNQWTKRWLTPMVGLMVLLAAAVVGALVFWSPGTMSGKKADVVAANSVDRARQAAEAQVADAEKARQAAEAKAAEATAAVVKSEQARQAAEAQSADAEKARQVAAAKAADAEKARQAAETKAADAEKARQAASKTVDDADKARQTATAKAAEADKARQAAEAKAAEATDAAAKSAQARQAAEVHAAEADKARLAAEAKAAGTVTTGSASPSSQFSRRSNMVANGSQASPFSIPAASIADCEQNCAQSNTCKVYTYNKKGGLCYMYSVADLTPSEYWDSGVLATVSSGLVSPVGQFSRRSNMQVRGPGGFARGGVASIDDCEQMCTRPDTCKAFTYNKSNRLCYLFPSFMDLLVNNDFDSGVRN
jgi:TIR domain/PAN domain